jgi:hypothetical protein
VALFGFGKKEAVPDGSPAGLPTDQILAMRQQGLSNNQIITVLQRDGFRPQQIFDAMNQADIKGGVEQIPMEQENYYQQQQQPFQQQQQSQQPQPSYEPGTERIEEVAEAIIDEKWNELVKNITKIVEWKEASEARLNRLEQEMKDLKGTFNELHKAVIGKIGEYDQNILAVGTEIKAMEKVFQKVLPTFTENVNELDRVTKEIRRATSKK